MAELDDIFGDEGFDADMYDIPDESSTPAEALAAELVGSGTAIVSAGKPSIFDKRGVAPSPYERNAEDYYQSGHVVGSGDATIKVKESLKAIGCKWHPLRSVWVAADAAMLAQARGIVKGGVNVTAPHKPKFTINRPQQAPAPALPHNATLPMPSSADAFMGIDPATGDDLQLQLAPSSGDEPIGTADEDAAEGDSVPVTLNVGIAPAQQAFPANSRKPKKQSAFEEQMKKCEGISTQALIQTLVDRRVLEELPDMLGDALNEIMPDADELADAFDLGDLE